MGKKILIDLNNCSLANIEELRVITGEKIKTRVISISLQITKELLNKVRDGKKIILRDKDGSEQEVTFIF